ncbi:MAG: hypothetical protein LQ341_002980 [Variospora aurantia]|nr:MAG: hypothetical protein LQ341_002980 [Variospora aurantia]
MKSEDLRTHATELDDLKMNSGLVFAEHTKKQNESITTLEEKLSVFSNKETTLRKKADAARSAFRDLFELIQHPPKVGSVAKEQVQTTAIQPSTSVSANSISLVKSQRSVNEESNAAANKNKQKSMPASSTINKAHPTPPQTQRKHAQNRAEEVQPPQAKRTKTSNQQPPRNDILIPPTPAPTAAPQKPCKGKLSRSMKTSTSRPVMRKKRKSVTTNCKVTNEDDDDGDDDGEWVEEDAGGEEPNNDEPWEVGMGSQNRFRR